ncbi:helix-turn-helix domain-containing protein [uncultured Methanobrevibacter sp.]|uniref:helix-turn-helix domain-containing protein n=1 Tax=uncultured Methanobrevibacter sp. TaxID=253161 RepID=UPI00262E6E10|nr:helix-turn-helix transcriptional regulator [uncultured Methanobrevibacter sp.]
MDDEFQKSIAKKLKELRKENNYTQTQVADYLKIDQGHLSNIENGKRTATIDIIEKLSDLYNCSLDYILDETSNYEPSKIAFRGDKKNKDLILIAKMNEVMKNLEFLRKLDDIYEQ